MIRVENGGENESPEHCEARFNLEAHGTGKQQVLKILEAAEGAVPFFDAAPEDEDDTEYPDDWVESIELGGHALQERFFPRLDGSGQLGSAVGGPYQQLKLERRVNDPRWSFLSQRYVGEKYYMSQTAGELPAIVKNKAEKISAAVNPLLMLGDLFNVIVAKGPTLIGGDTRPVMGMMKSLSLVGSMQEKAEQLVLTAAAAQKSAYEAVKRLQTMAKRVPNAVRDELHFNQILNFLRPVWKINRNLYPAHSVNSADQDFPYRAECYVELAVLSSVGWSSIKPSRTTFGAHNGDLSLLSQKGSAITHSGDHLLSTAHYPHLGSSSPFSVQHAELYLVGSEGTPKPAQGPISEGATQEIDAPATSDLNLPHAFLRIAGDLAHLIDDGYHIDVDVHAILPKSLSSQPHQSSRRKTRINGGIEGQESANVISILQKALLLPGGTIGEIRVEPGAKCKIHKFATRSTRKIRKRAKRRRRILQRIVTFHSSPHYFPGQFFPNADTAWTSPTGNATTPPRKGIDTASRHAASKLTRSVSSHLHRAQWCMIDRACWRVIVSQAISALAEQMQGTPYPASHAQAGRDAGKAFFSSRWHDDGHWMKISCAPENQPPAIPSQYPSQPFETGLKSELWVQQKVEILNVDPRCFTIKLSDVPMYCPHELYSAVGGGKRGVTPLTKIDLMVFASYDTSGGVHRPGARHVARGKRRCAPDGLVHLPAFSQLARCHLRNLFLRAWKGSVEFPLMCAEMHRKSFPLSRVNLLTHNPSPARLLFDWITWVYQQICTCNSYNFLSK
eukprot:GHVN01034512.1.p1 GENE.GHVN01034512.1~~GHVN01034512.1.p1  ORF type:complete len:787 (+),score=62.55 GHVN01034512.1:4897-7257(+)